MSLPVYIAELEVLGIDSETVRQLEALDAPSLDKAWPQLGQFAIVDIREACGLATPEALPRSAEAARLDAEARTARHSGNPQWRAIRARSVAAADAHDQRAGAYLRRFYPEAPRVSLMGV